MLLWQRVHVAGSRLGLLQSLKCADCDMLQLCAHPCSAATSCAVAYVQRRAAGAAHHDQMASHHNCTVCSHPTCFSSTQMPSAHCRTFLYCWWTLAWHVYFTKISHLPLAWQAHQVHHVSASLYLPCICKLAPVCAVVICAHVNTEVELGLGAIATGICMITSVQTACV